MNHTETPQISCRNVWKIFGPRPAKMLNQMTSQAASADHSATDAHSKASVLAQSGHVLAVRNVSFDVYPRETFVVMGLSGSGKSTLLRCLPRLIEPTAGQILIDGEDMARATTRQLRTMRRHKMSMVFQHFGLFTHRRVLDNVAYGLEVQGMSQSARHRRAAEVLEMVNLQGWEESYPDQLSGGMQQRVGLARALAVDPEIMLFDEPFSALDPLIRRDMQDELCGLQNQIHKTMIFITHDFTEALRMGDRIAIMKDGEFVQVGTPEEVMLHPATDYVREFTKDAPRALVLTARSIMQPADPQTISQADPIPASTTLNSLIPLVAESDAPIAVIDEQQTIIGSVDRTAVMLALAGV